MYNIYIWEDLKENSPQSQTRNQWLYYYGAFARYKGLWFPCKVLQYTPIGEPYSVQVLKIGTFNQENYPSTVRVQDLDVLYSVFNHGQSIEMYILKAMKIRNITNTMLESALKRSINTEIVTSPKKLMQQVKSAINSLWKGEIRVVTTHTSEDIKVIPLPQTADILEKLWNSNDWAMQEVSQLLGLSYNPAHGKKERMVKSELLGDRDITLMNRNKITTRLYKASEEFGEKVEHISNMIDTLDRGLLYNGDGTRQAIKGGGDNEGIQDNNVQ